MITGRFWFWRILKTGVFEALAFFLDIFAVRSAEADGNRPEILKTLKLKKVNVRTSEREYVRDFF